jgi:hypothetical protein
MQKWMYFDEEDNLVVFYYLRSSEIWTDKRGSLWWEWPYKRGTTVCKRIEISILFVKICFSGIELGRTRSQLHKSIYITVW